MIIVGRNQHVQGGVNMPLGKLERISDSPLRHYNPEGN